MIFMSQSGIIDPSQQEAWDQWYLAHLRIMLTVNGIDSAQRFMLLQGDNAPSLAMYTVASPAVFQDPYYVSIRGMGEWLPLIDRRHYRRTLFADVEMAPDVPETHVLLVADRLQPDRTLAGLAWIWLEAVALDRTPPCRGLAVLPGANALRVHGMGIASYRPVTTQLHT